MTAKRSVVLGCGSYLPQKVLTNVTLFSTTQSNQAAVTDG